MEREKLVTYLDEYLRVGQIDDYGPQGMQVEAAHDSVARIALAVDTAPAIIEAAADWGADMLLVHHGLLWRSVEPIAGPLGRRVRLLLENGITLYAAHLPLDAHPDVGNNAVLARMFEIEVKRWWCEPTNVPIGIVGRAPAGLTRSELVKQVEERLSTQVRLLAHGPHEITTVAIVSGFGADKAAEAKAMGADTLLTGETSHTNYWAAADHNLNIIYAGHYATETVGVRALGDHLAEQYDLKVKFFDFPTKM